MDEVLRRLLPRPPPPFASTTKGGTLRSRPRGDGRAVPPESFATLAWPPKGVSFDSGMDEVLRRLLPRPPPPFASTTKGGSPCFRPREDGRAVLPESFATLAWPPKGVSFDSGMDEEEKRLLPRPPPPFASPAKGGTLRSRPRGDGRAVPPESFATLAWPPKRVSFDSGMDEVLRRLLPRPPPPFASTTKGGSPCFQAREDGRAVPPECAATFTWHQKGVPCDSGMDEVLRRLLPRPRRLLLGRPKGAPCASKREETVERSLPSAPRPSLGIQSGYPSIP